jgi:hypothetical protein
MNTEKANKIYGARQIPSQCAIFATGGDDLFKAFAVQSQSDAGNCNRAFLIEGASFADGLLCLRNVLSPCPSTGPTANWKDYRRMVEIWKLLYASYEKNRGRTRMVL